MASTRLASSVSRSRNAGVARSLRTAARSRALASRIAAVCARTSPAAAARAALFASLEASASSRAAWRARTPSAAIASATDWDWATALRARAAERAGCLAVEAALTAALVIVQALGFVAGPGRGHPIGAFLGRARRSVINRWLPVSLRGTGPAPTPPGGTNRTRCRGKVPAGSTPEPTPRGSAFGACCRMPRVRGSNPTRIRQGRSGRLLSIEVRQRASGGAHPGIDNGGGRDAEFQRVDTTRCLRPHGGTVNVSSRSWPPLPERTSQ